MHSCFKLVSAYLWLCIFLCVGFSVNAQVYLHNFGNSNITTHPYTAVPTTINPNLSNSSWSNSNGTWTSGNGSSGEALRMTGGGTPSMSLTFQVNPNYALDISGIRFWRIRSNTGHSNFELRVNGTSVTTGTIGTSSAAANTNINIPTNFTGLTGTVTISLHLSGASGTAGNARFDDFQVDGNVYLNCTGATITSYFPTSGPENTLVKIYGNGFTAGTGTSSVTFGGVASLYTVISDTEIHAYIPATQTGAIVVNSNNCPTTAATNFTVVESVGASQPYNDLFISEIYDFPTGDGGVIELYNGTSNTIDLSTYTIRRYGDIGDTVYGTIQLTGTIAPGQVYLIGIGSGSIPCVFTEQMHYAIGFNGNDEFELYNGTTLVDNLHVMTTSPGYTQTRNNTAVAPKANFSAADWTLVTPQTCSDIGIFTPIISPIPPITQPVSLTRCVGESATFTAQPASTPAGIQYQWKQLIAADTWVNISNGGAFSGAQTASLTVNPAAVGLAPDQFYCEIRLNGTIIVSNAVQLNVTNTLTTPTFTQVAAICSGQTLSALPTTSLNGISGSWSPALNNTTTTTYTFTPDAGQCAENVDMTISVGNALTPSFNPISAICSGDTLAALPLTSTNGITGTWAPALNNLATTEYTFTPNSGQCAISTRLTITVNSLVTPTFNPVADVCSGSTISALPTTSLNGITGSWSPALNNTTSTTYSFTPDAGQCANGTTLRINVDNNIVPSFPVNTNVCAGTTTFPLSNTSSNGIVGSWSPAFNNTATTVYTFTPNSGQCGAQVQSTVTIDSPTIPTFNPVAAVCSGTTLSPLPTTSLNGITGTWSPALNNLATTTYTFAPNAGQCAQNTQLTINITSGTLPTFNPVNAICPGDILSPLPTVSLNGITGSWSPALNNSITTTYTFTPDAGQCAIQNQLRIVVNGSVIPTFIAVAPICQGETLSALPTTSQNGITGSWSPAIDNTQTRTYTFHPDAGQCAQQVQMTIVVNNAILPSFNPVATVCKGGSLTTLPGTSLNGITGSWLPALNNQATTTYTFTPDAGQCATQAQLTIGINPLTIPTFNAVAPTCIGGSLTTLPGTSLNGITGIWTPALNNQQTTTYTFTPDAGQCADIARMTIDVNPKSTPIFSQIPAICEGETLGFFPTLSLNGISGTWSPAPNPSATTTYTFTPSAGECANEVQMTVVVNSKIQPTFNQVAGVCLNAFMNQLPTISLEGIVGTWSPALDNQITTTYTFTPLAGQCAKTAEMTITVSTRTIPAFDPIAAVCAGENVILPTTSTNGITGSWLPDFNNQESTTYTFTPDAGQCAPSVQLTVGILETPVYTLNSSNLCLDASGNPQADAVITTGLPQAGYSFTWTKNGDLLTETTPDISVNSVGDYEVTVTLLSSGCSISQSVTIQASTPIQIVVTTPEDFSGNRTATVQVTGGSGNFTYQLDGNTPQTHSTFAGLEPGHHEVIVQDIDGCGIATAEFYFLDYPKYFTPNGDGYNDYWNIAALEDQPAKISIFDRYGKLLKMFKPSHDNGWDGTYNGYPLPSTDYWFVLEYVTPLGDAREFKAHFSLKR